MTSSSATIQAEVPAATPPMRLVMRDAQSVPPRCPPGPRGRRPSRTSQIMTTRVGLHLPDQLPYDAWEEAGQKIFRIVDSSAWCLGDWLVYGQDRYDDRYRRAVDAAGLDYQTLRNYAWVARKFELSRRREQLSFQHHAELASLPPADQDAWLDRAIEHGWSRTQLRREVRAARTGKPAAPPELTRLPELRVADETVRRWRAAAERAGAGLDEWVITTLDRAAATPEVVA